MNPCHPTTPQMPTAMPATTDTKLRLNTGGRVGQGAPANSFRSRFQPVASAHKKLSADRLTLRAAGLTRSSCLAAFLLAGAICAGGSSVHRSVPLLFKFLKFVYVTPLTPNSAYGKSVKLMTSIDADSMQKEAILSLSIAYVC